MRESELALQKASFNNEESVNRTPIRCWCLDDIPLRARQAHAITLAREETSNQYYTKYVGNVEWVLIPPQLFGSHQTFWVTYPAAVVFYSDGTTNIPGSWQALKANLVTFIPNYRLEDSSNPNYNPNYLGQQQLDGNLVVRASTITMQEAACMAETPGYAQSGYKDPCGLSDCLTHPP